MENVDIRQLYDADPRPTFIVDCQSPLATIYHVNTALLAIPSVALSLHTHNALRDWWDPASRVASRLQTEFRHGRYRWAKFTVSRRWLVVTIVKQPPSADGEAGLLQEPVRLERITSPSLKTQSDTIFTVRIQSPELKEHIECLKRVDWASTSLGPITNWSYELNVLVTTVLLDTRPTALFLGPDRIIVYNLAYGEVSGSRHPKILGKSIIDAWPELADPVSATMERSQQTQFADAPEEEYHFMVERNGFVEESFFMWSLVPLVGIGSIDGMYSIVTEVTSQRLLSRRVNAVLELGRYTSMAHDTHSFWASIREAMRPFEYDFPVALLYSQSTLLEPSDATDPLGLCTLEWTIGYTADHPAIPKDLNLKDDSGFARALSDSARAGAALLFRKTDGVLPEPLYTDVEKRGFGDPCTVFLVVPIRTYDDTVAGYLITGLNTRRPYDAEYQDWIKVYLNLLGACAASVALHEEEIRNRKRQEEQAREDREALNAEVATLTQEASDVAEKLRHFHDIANTVGLGFFESSVSGKLLHANETYFCQTGHRRDLANAPPFSFFDYIYEGDVETARMKWGSLVAGEPTTFEIRWKKQLRPQNERRDDTENYLWTLTACVPIKAEDGTVTGIFGCNTDISAQKEATRAALLCSEAERRLASFTELAPVGLWHVDSNLQMKYCNDEYFRITGHPKVPGWQVEWPSVVHPDDLALTYQEVNAAVERGGLNSFTIRLAKSWTGPDGVSSPAWTLVLATVTYDDEGKMSSLIGSMTDVSQLKWAEAIQKSQVEEALESKRQQENFIDMTSHEMRNPLSAMVQCADSISSSLKTMDVFTREDSIAAQPILQSQLKEMISTSLDAVETIQACATHQKRIVDDILTLSKLDSKLLVISPITLQPAVLLQNTYKMFKDEASKASVNLSVRCDTSIDDMHVDWAILDPSRVLQVLINLLTNAIKFTQGQPIRDVEVIMGASPTVKKMADLEYVPQETFREDFLTQSEWDFGEVFYLNFTVRDTGCGLSPEHKAKLFLRFSQATPKTHVQYGGSGLGLFISRELTEMQGGSIGVSSTQNLGSTFSFYIKSRRAPAPHHNLPSHPLSKADLISQNPNKNPPSSENASPSKSLQGTKEISSKENNQDKKKYHILVVEDNLINQRVLTTQLSKLGHTCHVANHGLEALAILQKSQFAPSPSPSPSSPSPSQSTPSSPTKTTTTTTTTTSPIADLIPLSVVLMDIEMPLMDGLTATRRIRAMEESGQLQGHVPIIAVSANARREQVMKAKEAGVDEAICKPFRIPELVRLVEGLGL